MNTISSPQPAQSNSPDYRALLKTHPFIGLSGIVAFLNWFLCAGFNGILGGDALGILPSRDGFILNSHGHHTTVSESVWLFSLIYTGTTILLTPIIMLMFARQLFAPQIKQQSVSTKYLLGVFLTLFLLTWETSIFRSANQSLNDWSRLNRRSTSEQEHSAAEH